MTHVFTTDGNLTNIAVSFADEGVDLTGETSVIGDEQKALDYLPFFERDLRLNFADRFPQPEPPAGGMIGGIE